MIPLKLSLLLCVLAVVSTSLISQSITQTAKSDNCSVNVAQVTGNVVVRCDGVSDRAIKPLEKEINSRRLSEQQALEEASKWRSQYEQLLATLSDANISEALKVQAQKFLEVGNLDAAAKLLDKAIDSEKNELEQAASMHFTRGLIAELQFDTPAALVNYERAHALNPQNIIIAFSYGNLLLSLHNYPKAADVFEVLLDHPSSLPAGEKSVAATFLNVGSAYRGLDRLDAAEKAYLNAKELFAKEGSLESRRNEGAAVLAIANLKFQLGEKKHAVDMAEEGVSLVRGGLEKGGRGTDQLASALDELASFRSEAGMNDQASDDIQESIKLWKSPAATVLGTVNPERKVRSGLAGALNTECKILGKSGNIVDAGKAAQEALSIYKDLATAEPDKYQPKIASTLLNLGVAMFLQGDLSTAQNNFQDSIDIYKDQEEKGHSEYQPDLAQTLIDLAVTDLRLSQAEEASKQADKAIQIAIVLANKSRRYDDLIQTITNNAISIYAVAGEAQKVQEAQTLKQKVSQKESN